MQELKPLDYGFGKEFRVWGLINSLSRVSCLGFCSPTTPYPALFKPRSPRSENSKKKLRNVKPLNLRLEAESPSRKDGKPSHKAFIIGRWFWGAL